MPHQYTTPSGHICVKDSLIERNRMTAPCSIWPPGTGCGLWRWHWQPCWPLTGDCRRMFLLVTSWWRRPPLRPSHTKLELLLTIQTTRSQHDTLTSGELISISINDFSKCSYYFGKFPIFVFGYLELLKNTLSTVLY